MFLGGHLSQGEFIMLLGGAMPARTNESIE